MRAALLVFLGGGLGSVLRYGVGLLAARAGAAPLGTLAVNLVGCFAIGWLARVLPDPLGGGAEARLLLMTGLLGGFTTFSAFSLDAAGLALKGDGALAFGYVAASVAGSLAAVAAGFWLGGLGDGR